MNELPPTDPSPPLADRLMKGAVWTVAMRWGIRLLGLVSMIVLVRLLAPEDFGLLAMAMAIVSLVDILTDFGISAALIRSKHAGPKLFDTAWTVRQLQLLAVAATVAVCAPLAASYYQDPRITTVMRIVAFAFAIRSFENIGVINFQRELMFHRDFVFRVSVKFTGVIATMILAIWLRSYWALILGMVIDSLARVVFSYWMNSYRPTWSLSAWRELWGFSQWVLSQGLARYIYERSDVLFLGGLTSAGNIGYYTVSSEIAALPASEISLPVSRAVFPGFAQLADEPKRLKEAYLNTLGAVATVTIPIGFGMAAVANEIVELLLGEKWLPAIELLQVFALFATFRALNSLSGNLLVVLGYIRYNALVLWLQAILLVAAIIPIFHLADLIGVAILRASLSLLGLVLVLHFVVRVSRVYWINLVETLLRPALAGAAMMALIVSANIFVTVDVSPTHAELSVSLFAKVLAGALLYVVVLFTSWRLAGKPDGFESFALDKLQQIRNRLSN